MNLCLVLWGILRVVILHVVRIGNDKGTFSVTKCACVSPKNPCKNPWTLHICLIGVNKPPFLFSFFRVSSEFLQSSLSPFLYTLCSHFVPTLFPLCSRALASWPSCLSLASALVALARIFVNHRRGFLGFLGLRGLRCLALLRGLCGGLRDLALLRRLAGLRGRDRRVRRVRRGKKRRKGKRRCRRCDRNG